jgi:hypothetical protein
VNPFVAVAIIIAVFFVAGLVVGFLIVMALPALVSRRGSNPRGVRRADGQRGGGRLPNGGPGPRRPGWPEPRTWPGTRPFGTDPDGDDLDGEDYGTNDQGGPPDRPWWTGGP